MLRGRQLLAALLAALALPAAASADSLPVVRAPIPALNVPGYDTSGTFPQLSSGFADVNAALMKTVTDEQLRYAPGARRHPSTEVFETAPRTSLIAATSSVVTVLVPLRELYPGGNDGDEWLSATLEVPSGTKLELPALLATGGLARVAALVRHGLPATNACARGSLRDKVVGELNAREYSPTAAHYRQFALRRAGLVVGFANGAVASPACGRLDYTIPYAEIAPSLNALGRRLFASIRA